MSLQFSFGKGFLRAAVSLGMGCLIAQGNLLGASASSEPSTAIEALASASPKTPNVCAIALAAATHEGDILRLTCSGLMLTSPLEIGMPDALGVALEDEDSIEMFRFEIQQRVFGVDQKMVRARISPGIARDTRLSFSPPLLV